MTANDGKDKEGVLLLSEGDTLASAKPESFWDLPDLDRPELGKLWLLIG